MNHHRNEDRHEDDVPPYSRIFIVCSKDISEKTLREAFQEYGEITNLYMPKHRDTGEPKGVAYIKYTKTSSAAAAIRDLNLQTIGNCKKPIKVMIATSKNDNTNVSVENNDRLFIKVSKESTTDDIREYFSQFGEIQSVYIQKDKNTNESRGLAYVHFKNFVEAAKALEECDKKYRAVFASPKHQELKRGRDDKPNQEQWPLAPRRDNYSDYSNEFSRPNSMNSALNTLIKAPPQSFKSVLLTCTPMVPQIYLEKLSNIVPGLSDFQYSNESYKGICRALVTYENEVAAAHAVDRLHNFEFPSGERISAQPDNPLSKAANDLSNIVNSFKNAVDTGSPDLVQLADAIAQASTLIKAATTGRIDARPDSIGQDMCNVPLPDIQPLAPPNSHVAIRCFIVCRPNPPPIHVLQNVFCRFGDLIEISTFPKRSFCFAKYASVKAGQRAINSLHGATVAGATLKVMIADDKPSRDDMDHDGDAKKMKLNDRD